MRARSILKEVALRIPHLRRLVQQRNDALEEVARLTTAGPPRDDRDLALALMAFDLDTAIAAPNAAVTALELTDEYRRQFRRILLETFFRDWPQASIESPSFESDIADHVDKRYALFAQHVVPWLTQAQADLSGSTALEIGSGTGSSTLAFAPHVQDIVCFEIDRLSMDAAKQRMDLFGLYNVEYRNEAFGPEGEFVASGRTVDLVVLCAVLEHMSYDELTVALHTAWQVLKTGGLLVIADTPNRLAIVDHHTSLLPYFSALPYELMVDYARFSPREAFRDAVAGAAPQEQRNLITRWGRGISYHDFELAIGPHIHDHVALDGYEPIIRACNPPAIEDALLRYAFKHHQIRAHRAFTRGNLYFALRK
jgi:ubiquinone/menaquinone biosynthesis C-methylase UbiE